MADIFISYAREDAETARLLAGQLEAQGRSVFWDRRIPAGRRFAEFIGEQLDTAKCVITLWSHAAVASNWVQEEADEAIKRRILIPAFIEAVEPPLGFRRIQAADLVDWHGEEGHEGFQQLVRDIGQYIPMQTSIRQSPESGAGGVPAAGLDREGAGPDRLRRETPGLEPPIAAAEDWEKDKEASLQHERAGEHQQVPEKAEIQHRATEEEKAARGLAWQASAPAISEFPQVRQAQDHRGSRYVKLAAAVVAAVLCAAAARQAIVWKSARIASKDDFAKGVQALKTSQYVQAVEFLTESVSLNPSVQARLYLAEAYKLQLGLAVASPKNEHPGEAALQQYQAILKQEPNNIIAICSIGLISLEQQKYAEAERWYKKATEVSPQNNVGFYGLGVIAWSKADSEIMSARARAGMDIGDPPPIKDRAIRAEMRDKHLAAVEAGVASMRKALELDKDDADAMLYINLLYRELANLAQGVIQARKDSDEADDWLNKYLTARKNKAETGSRKEQGFLIAPGPPPPPPPPPPA